MIKRIAVLTSGGDAPGMNACIRAVVLTAAAYNIDVIGFHHGYNGLLEEDYQTLLPQHVQHIIQHGGTILKSARCKALYTEQGAIQAAEVLHKLQLDALVIIGGDGSFRGAQKFSNEFDIPCIGLPGTIDKDIAGSDFTIGFDTAVNTAVEAIDKIRDTADAHDRLFIIEVMGRDAGYIALHSGIATGAEHILIPETKTDLELVVDSLEEKERRKKLVNMIVVAEGDETGGANEVATIIKKRLPHLDTRVCILGHIQRGGSPTCLDRLIASRLGYAAVDALIEGKHNTMIGIMNNKLHFTPLDKAVKAKQRISDEWMKIVKILAS